MTLRTPPLRETHADRGASFTGFGGWEMPVEFDSITTEHEAVRETAGIFDVSHMGEIEVTGPDATRLMQRLTTNDPSGLAPGEAQYTAILREDGTLIDDTVVYRLPDRTDDGEAYLFVPNAGNDTDAYDRWVDCRDEEDLAATVRNVTEEWAMFAVQGPDAPGTVDAAADTDLTTLDRFDIAEATVAGVDCLVARTGYTGEDGFEILCPWGAAAAVWDAFDVQPCGLGARDTLRIEQGFLLSGQDFHPDEEPRTPHEAGIGFAVDTQTAFVGREAVADTGDPEEVFVGFELLDRGIARHGYDVVDDDGETVGVVTSGTKVPTLDSPVALGYVPAELADPGTELAVLVRGRETAARVTEPPFGG
ncbi:MAG: glycine cleavage system T protein [halophilic archaeon J07HB67]|nr:MAG: glycine cleavage system T protein [halophilic archaeon J07HB67]